MDKKEVAKALRSARRNAGLTCKEVASVVDKSEKTVSAWEHCNGQPDVTSLFRLCKLYNISSIDEMLGAVIADNLFDTLRIEEKDLLSTYRELTPNSKQIVMTVANLERKHIDAVKQGATPIRILPKTKSEMDARVDAKLERKSEAERARLIKVFTQSAAAGYGNFVDDSDFEMISVPSIPHGAEFGIKITGDSMMPNIRHGDIVFVTRQASIEVGEIGIFIYDGGAYCKQLAYRNGTYFLHSLNREYRDIPILDDSTFTVGKVLGTYNGTDVEVARV